MPTVDLPLTVTGPLSVALALAAGRAAAAGADAKALVGGGSGFWAMEASSQVCSGCALGADSEFCSACAIGAGTAATRTSSFAPLAAVLLTCWIGSIGAGLLLTAGVEPQ